MEQKMMKTLEQLTSMELLTNALRTRGFFVRYLANRLILQPGSGRRDVRYLQKLFDALHIQASYREDMVILDEFHVTEELVERISLFRAYNQESWCPQHMRSWKAFTKRRHGYKLDTLTLDAGVAYLVKMLSKAGILTEMSCDGHGKRPPSIWFAGGFNAAWFEMISHKLLSAEDFHYRWIVEEKRGNQILTAKKPLSESWNLAYVQEDAMKLGAYLDEHADELRDAKRSSFKYRSMKEQAMVLSGDFAALKMWMRERSSYFNEVSM
ncbi:MULTISPECIES: hypothetical protein [unclassified Paenibacillus]|uniref:hypothetical protein n=1 Tax=unclassified Paenibacillus TaxID=185978 RepID=UPI001AE7A91E|nr:MULTISPECIES: hypothetical protein [unclassified Paenibacillus]MBP1154023.1 hypothetical protein [Paenibacillus sp. PvP091]MBP1170592.1 hypothetical protein [Paenibacillus sp. PvR098]MBP2441620.1 hypothetical protein [Paenibacillus sp. PvP052]